MVKYVKTIKFGETGEPYIVQDSAAQAAISEMISGEQFVLANQGSENAGKVLAVNSEGNVSPKDIEIPEDIASKEYVDNAIDEVEAKIPSIDGLATESYVDNAVSSKQDTLVSGTNIKTINNQSILGEGNLVIEGGSGTSDYDQLENRPQIAGVTLSGNKSLSDLGIASQEDLNAKADASTTYTKTEVDTALAAKANSEDIQDLVSQSSMEEYVSSQVEGLATEEYVDQAIADIDIPDFSSKQDVLTPDDTITIQKKTVHGKNYFNQATQVDDYFINANGTRSGGPDTSFAGKYGMSALMEVEEGQTFTYTSDFALPEPTSNVRVHGYNANGEWVEQISSALSGSWTGSLTYTIPAGVKYMLINYCRPYTWIQVEEGTVGTTFEPYEEHEITEIGANIDMEAINQMVEEAVENIDIASTDFGKDITYTNDTLEVDGVHRLAESFWNLNTYNVGDVYPMVPATTNPAWSCFKFDMNAGDYIALANIGGQNGRCYAVIDKADNKILVLAPANTTTTVASPYEYTADRPVWFIGSCTTKNFASFQAHIVSHLSIGEIKDTADDAYETANTALATAQAALSNSAPASKIHNPKCRMDKDTFRVLDIGNSFTQDCTNYMPSLVTYLTANKGLDVSNMSFTGAYRGGASYKNWFDIFHDKDTSSYTISKIFGGLNETYNGTAGAGNGEKFRRCLQEHKFDLIIIHQVSTYSGTYEQWEGHGADGYLKEFVRLLRYYQPQAHIGFLMVHASPRQMAAGETTTREQWQRIANGAKWIAQNYGMDFVIPAGTAVENLRISKWGHIDQDLTKGFVAHQLTRDNHHMADGLCRYTGTCAYWETVFAPYFGITSYNCGWTYQSVNPPSGYEQDTIQVTAYNAQAAQMATMLAVNDMYTLNSPDDLYIGPEDEVPPAPEPEPEPEDLRPDPTPLPDENYDILTSYTATAGTAMEGATKQPLYRIGETGTMVPGFCSFGSTSNTGEIYTCTNNKGLHTGHSTNAYFTYDKLLPLGTVVQIPAGIKARVQYYNNTTNRYIRYESEIGPDGVTLVLGSELDLTRFNDLQPDGAYVHFYATADSGQGGSVVNVAFIESRLAQYQIVIKTPKSADPLDGYTQVTLSAPDNMENGWWGYAATTNASTTTNTAGELLPINDANGAHVAGSVGNNQGNTKNCNSSTQVFIRPKESLVIPVNSYVKVPEGYSCRPNFVKTNQYWWRSATTITAGEYVKLDPTVFASSAGVTFDRVYISIQKTADSGTGKRDATFTDETAINTYINAKVAEGIELWVPNS